jgi:hypothetical protein
MSASRRLTPEKKNVMANLIEVYGIKTTKDLQDALKDRRHYSVDYARKLGYALLRSVR